MKITPVSPQTAVVPKENCRGTPVVFDGGVGEGVGVVCGKQEGWVSAVAGDLS